MKKWLIALAVIIVGIVIVSLVVIILKVNEHLKPTQLDQAVDSLQYHRELRMSYEDSVKAHKKKELQYENEFKSLVDSIRSGNADNIRAIKQRNRAEIEESIRRKFYGNGLPVSP